MHKGIAAPLRRHTPQSCKNYLFIGAVTVAAGALSLRRFRKPAVSPRAIHSKAALSETTMYGGGKGVSVPAPGKADAAVIFMHGLGDTGHGWASAFPMKGLENVEAILPTADDQPVTLNAGFRMPSWFDLKGLDETAPDDEAGILSSVERMDRIVEEQIQKGIPENRIVVAGFSQGGAISLTFGLRTKRKIAGVVGLSTWLPLRSQYPEKLSEVSKDVQIFMGHGSIDPVVSCSFGQESATIIQGMDRKVDFRQYAGLPHAAAPQELEDVRNFIARVLSE